MGRTSYIGLASALNSILCGPVGAVRDGQEVPILLDRLVKRQVLSHA